MADARASARELYEQRESLRREVSNFDELIYKKIFQRQREEALASTEENYSMYLARKGYARIYYESYEEKQCKDSFKTQLFSGKLIFHKRYLNCEPAMTTEEWRFLKGYFRYIGYNYKRYWTEDDMHFREAEYWATLNDLELAKRYTFDCHDFHWNTVEIKSAEMMDFLLGHAPKHRDLLFDIPANNREMIDYFRQLAWAPGTIFHGEISRFRYLSTLKAFFPYSSYKNYEEFFDAYLRQGRDTVFSVWKSVIPDGPIRRPCLQEFWRDSLENELFVEAILYLNSKFHGSGHSGELDHLFSLYMEEHSESFTIRQPKKYSLAMKDLIKKGMDPSLGTYDFSKWKNLLSELRYQTALKKMTKILGPSAVPV